MYMPEFFATLELLQGRAVLLLNFNHLTGARWEIGLESFWVETLGICSFRSKKLKKKKPLEKTTVAALWGQAAAICRDILTGTCILRGD